MRGREDERRGGIVDEVDGLHALVRRTVRPNAGGRDQPIDAELRADAVVVALDTGRCAVLALEHGSTSALVPVEQRNANAERDENGRDRGRDRAFHGA
jgi:hypothetical protein